MAEDVAVKDLLTNPCCVEWENRCSKLQEKLRKSENSRKALRDAVATLGKQLNVMHTDNLNLKKASEEERARADNEREEKMKESAFRVSLENEISVLKTQTLSLQQKAQGMEKELRPLQVHASEGKAEIKRLNELLEKETIRADLEKKKAEAEKKKANEAWEIMKAERSKADEEMKKIGDIEAKQNEENRLRLESLKSEAGEVRSKLVLEELKLHEANKKLDVERQNVIKEKERADLEMAKAEEQKKLAEMSKKMVVDEQCRAACLSQQLKQDRQMIQKLKKEIEELLSSRKVVDIPAGLLDMHIHAETTECKGDLQSVMLRREANKSKLGLDCLKFEVREQKSEEEKQKKIMKKDNADLEMRKAVEQNKVAEKYKEEAREKKRRAVQLTRKLEEEKQKRIVEKNRAESEMRKAEDQTKLAEQYKKEATEEKLRADRLAQELEDNRQRINELRSEILELVSDRKLVEAHNVVPDKKMTAEDGQIKLLKKQLKLGKMQLKHAKQVVSWERNCNNILRQEIRRIKQEFVQFSQRLEIVGNYFTYRGEGLNDLAMTADVANMYPMNLRTKHFDVEQYRMQFLSKNEPVKPTSTGSMTMDGLHPFKLNIPCTRQSLPISKGNGTKSISGIDSKLGLMHRGSKRKLLQSSAKNSSAASFSDRQLLGSQERDASAKLTEEISNTKPSLHRLSAETTCMRCNENVAVVAENSVRSPISSGMAEKKAWHCNKREEILDAVESIEHLYSDSQKWHMQIAEKLSVLHGILSSQVDKPLEPRKYLMRNLEGRSHKKRKISSEEEASMWHLHGFDEIENRLGNKVNEKRDICTQVIGTVKGTIDRIGDSIRSGEKNFGSFDEVLGSDYMKLLDLDDDVDEESYRVAVERPVSPTLPEIEFRRTEQHEMDNFEALAMTCFNDGSLNENAGLVPFGCFDVINVEIDSNMLKFNTSSTSRISHYPSLDKNECFVDSFQNLANCESGNCGIAQIWDSGMGLGMPDLSCNLPEYCVVSSDITDGSSIYRICWALGNCVAKCSMLSQVDQVVRNSLHSLFKVEDISTKEKGCVFFSLLLHKVSGIVSGNFVLDKDYTLFLDSFAGQMHAVLSDAATSSLFVEVCNLGELLSLIEDFLIDRRVLLRGDISSTCDSSVNFIRYGADIIFSFQAASTHQLMAGAILLASVCKAVGHIGFICEASYNILRTQKVNSPLILAILHVFAYLCGSKYFNLKEYGLVMTVVKSIVMSFEKVDLLTDATSCYPFVPTETRCQFPSFPECPFSDGASSVEVVILLLLETLQNYAFSSNRCSQNDLAKSSNSGDLFDGDNGGKYSGQVDNLCEVNVNCDVSCSLSKLGMVSIQSNAVFDATTCHLSDFLSLVELVACNMNWKWTYDNVVHRLLKILESCMLEKYLVAIVLLLGQLGKVGVAANGYEDTGVESLRVSLSAFLLQSTSRNLCFQIQIATATALLGLLPYNFEVFTGNDLELPAVIGHSVSFDSIREWFSLLGEEQRSLLCRLQHTS